MKRVILIVGALLFLAGTGFGAIVWKSETQNIISPNHPSAYGNNYNNTWTITKAGALSMRVYFSAFNTESGYDKVFIQNSAGTAIATYSGNKGAFTSAAVTGSTIKIKFTSDGSVTASGWKIARVEWSIDDGSSPPPAETWQTETQNITSPNHPSAYGNNYNNTWTITKSGATKIRVRFSAFDTEANYDFVYIQNSAAANVATYSGAKGAFTSAEVTGNTIKIKFTSDGSVTKTGWKVDRVEWVGTSTPPAPVASTKPGMGAIPYTGGVTFRVWAPNASAVAVAGDFNSWSGTANALVKEGTSGFWSVDVPSAAANQQYKFAITYNGSVIWRNDPHARQMTSSVGNSIIVNRTFSWSSFSTPSWGEMVIYELHPKTWTAGISGTTTIFAKVASKAAYLKDTLAVNAVKVMPVAEFAGDYSWGYNPGNPFAVESHYGGYAAYKSMVNTLHQNGIAVIQDIVHNHYGPSDLALWCFDGPSFGNGGIYFYTDWRKNTPWGDTRPDYGRGEVRSYIRDNAIYWLEEMGADGLRWDATVYIRKTAYDGSDIPEGWTLLQWIHNEKNARFSWKISIAEDLQGDAWVTKTTGEGGAGFDSQWDPNYLHKMRDELKKGNDGDRNMFTVRDVIAKIDNGNATRLTKYTESHDECAGANGKQRLIQDIDQYNARSYWAKKRAGLGLVLAVFSPGVPMIWQGQENLETGNWSDTKNFSWADTTTFAGYVSMVRDANRLKRNWYNNTRGFRGNGINVHHVNNSGKVIAFHRWQNGGSGDDVIVVANFGNTQYASYNIGAPSTGTWYCRYNSDWNGYDAGFGNYGGQNTTAYSGAKDGMANNMNVALGGYAVLVFSK